MRAEIISIGTEIITGATVDTNSAWLSERLGRLGVGVDRHVTVGDCRSAIAAAVGDSAGRCRLVVLTGGLGPTRDDLVRAALSEASNQPLETDATSLALIERFFASRGITMSASNRAQALIPRGATALQNEWGTAPGIGLTLGNARVFALPGVPREMREMFDRYLVPFVLSAESPVRQPMAVRVLRTCGAGESDLAERIADLMEPGRNPSVGTTAKDGIISVRILAHSECADTAAALADQDVRRVRKTLGKLVFGEDEDSLATAVGRALKGEGKTVATAESCTGGLIGKLLTDVPGSSDYFVGGFVVYGNELKSSALKVPVDLIARCGAVSPEVARSMAEGCRRAAGSDYAISATGIAGPTGDSADKPVGLVHIGLAGPAGSTVKELRFGAHLGRMATRDRAATAALNLLRQQLSREFR